MEDGGRLEGGWREAGGRMEGGRKEAWREVPGRPKSEDQRRKFGTYTISFASRRRVLGIVFDQDSKSLWVRKSGGL
jgi:hypothetical protein